MDQLLMLASQIGALGALTLSGAAAIYEIRRDRKALQSGVPPVPASRKQVASGFGCLTLLLSPSLISVGIKIGWTDAAATFSCLGLVLVAVLPSRFAARRARLLASGSAIVFGVLLYMAIMVIWFADGAAPLMAGLYITTVGFTVGMAATIFYQSVTQTDGQS